MLPCLVAAAWGSLLLMATPIRSETAEAGCEPPSSLAISEEDGLLRDGSSGGVSMLQRSSLGHAAVTRPERQGSMSPAASIDAVSGSGSGDGVPATQSFRDVRMLYLRLPISQAIREQARVGGIFGESKDPQHGGFQLDESGSAQVKIAYYPDAQIGWAGEVRASAPENVPHHLLSVQLPMLEGGRQLYQTTYALTDDDLAMMLYRLGHGLPAKLANMSFPSSSSFPEGQSINVSRRGVDVLRIEGLSDEGKADLGAVEEMFNRPDIDWGTAASNDLASIGLAPKDTYKRHVTKATVKDARKVKVSFSANEGQHEFFKSMFSSLEPLEAYWLQADLVVTTSMVSAAPSPFHPPVEPWANVTEWRLLGDVVTGTRDRSLQFPRMSYHKGEVIWMKMKISKDKVAPYLPPGVQVADDEEGLLWHVRWQPADVVNFWGMLNPVADVMPLEYNELWVTMPVTVRGRRYMYPILMMLDDDIGLMSGHDFIGCPKKLANLTFTFSPRPGPNSRVFLEVDRRGRQVLQVSGHVTERKQKPVLGINDHTDPGSDILWLFSQQFPWDPALDRPRLLFFQSSERTYDQRELSDVEVTLGSAAPEPLAEWFVGQPTTAGYVKMDQDWLPSARTPPDMQLEAIDADGFTAWWKRAFPVLYM